MPQSKKEVHSYEEYGIDIRESLNSLVKRRFLIAGFTIFVTVLAILYTLITSTYITSYSFISASKSSITTINKMDLTTETKESVLKNFLNQMSSPDLQLKVFVDGNYLAALKSENAKIDTASSFLNSLIIKGPTTENEIFVNLIESPSLVSMEGNNIEIISRYLDELIASTNIQTIDNLTSINKLNISIRLEEISIERARLIKQAEKSRLAKILRIKEEDSQRIREIKDQMSELRLRTKHSRLNQIKRIKESDNQKIREIKDQIARSRSQAKEIRMNQIVVLTDAAKLAGYLGIIENNLKQIDMLDKAANVNFNFDFSDDAKNLPEWYLYGEKALLQRVQLLKERVSDDPFIPELVTLKNQLKEAQFNNTLKTLEERLDDEPFIPEIVSLQNQTLIEESLKNQLLKTLEERKDDSPFINEIVKLDIEKSKLESRTVDLSGVNAIQLRKSAKVKVLKPYQNWIILLAFISSFMMSIFLAFIMDALKPNEKTSS